MTPDGEMTDETRRALVNELTSRAADLRDYADRQHQAATRSRGEAAMNDRRAEESLALAAQYDQLARTVTDGRAELPTDRRTKP